MTAYTVSGAPEAEARVEADLARVVAAVRETARDDGLAAVVLLGSFARGEGAVVLADDGTPRGFNDYDFLLLFDRMPPSSDRYRALAGRLARELDIDFVDLGLATARELSAAPPTLFWFELGEAHRILWRRLGTAVPIPRFKMTEIDPAEGSRLLLNRGMGLLWGALRIWPDRPEAAPPPSIDRATLRFAVTAAHKAILAAGDAALLRLGGYSVRQEDRLARILDLGNATAWAEEGFAEIYRRAVAFRRRPEFERCAVGELWWQARFVHEQGFRAAEAWFRGEAVKDWADHRGAIRRGVALQTLRSPKRLVKRALRRLGAAPADDLEETLFLELPQLLYVGPGAAPRDWRDRAQALITRWHP